jgi:hypothetical protein
VCRKLGFTGAHVSRAARIEPITPHATIWASEEFAAVAETEGVDHFVCDYVGTKSLAKKYPGVFKLFQLRRVRRMPLEALARAIHDKYRRAMEVAGADPIKVPNMRPWDTVSPDVHEENQKQATDIKAKLDAVGYELVPRSRAARTDLTLSEEQVEKLAIAEHDRWMQSRVGLGWRYGERRDDEKKLHPCIVPWDRLPPEEKAKDYDIVRNIPTLLLMAGFEAVLRRVPGAGH